MHSKQFSGGPAIKWVCDVRADFRSSYPCQQTAVFDWLANKCRVRPKMEAWMDVCKPFVSSYFISRVLLGKKLSCRQD